MLLTIGIYSYLLSKSCTSMGDVGYPLSDKGSQQRIIEVCTDYGPEQTRQVFIHEVMHACLHNHEHNFKTKQELQDHLDYVERQPEEALVSNLSVCLTAVLEDKDALRFFSLEQRDSFGSGSREMFSQTGKAAIANQQRHSNKHSSKRTVTLVEVTAKKQRLSVRSGK